eukprot:4015672-Prymnesium_polylepis.2
MRAARVITHRVVLLPVLGTGPLGSIISSGAASSSSVGSRAQAMGGSRLGTAPGAVAELAAPIAVSDCGGACMASGRAPPWRRRACGEVRSVQWFDGSLMTPQFKDALRTKGSESRNIQRGMQEL